MVCLEFKPGAAIWKAQTNPLSYDSTPTILFFKKWAIPGLFILIFVFSMQLTEYKYVQYKSFADDWIRTVDLWCRKRPLYQLRHNHCPPRPLFGVLFGL